MAGIIKVVNMVTLLVTIRAKNEEYLGWKSYLIKLEGNQFKAFGVMVEQYELDVLRRPIAGREGVVLVKPEYHAAFIEDMEAEGIFYKIHVHDLKRRLDYDDELNERQQEESLSRSGDRMMFFDSYQELERIYDYMDYISNEYPNIVTVVNSAITYEGRPIKYLKISTTNFESPKKRIIFIDGGIHAREWISPPTVVWAIHKLVENVTEPYLLKRFDWILLPVVNPDGYKYSFTDSRLWRKSRSTDGYSSTDRCPGVDINRNFEFKWKTVGASDDPCSDVYAGSHPFSEVESRAVRDILKENLPRLTLYISMHSYGNMILYPWGHDGTLPRNSFRVHLVAVSMAEAMTNLSLPEFPPYIAGNSALVLNYGIAGASEDYAHEIGVPLSYIFELPGLTKSKSGFHLHPDKIKHVCHETWEGIVFGARRAGFKNN